MKNNIRIYEVKSEYIKYLSQYQKNLFMYDNGTERLEWFSYHKESEWV